MNNYFIKDIQYYKFCLYGFLKNLRFFEAFLILFFLEKGLSFLEVGTLYAFREITRNVLEIPTGIFTDSFGRRKTMVMAFLLYISSFVVFYVALDYYLFLIAMIVFSIADALRSGTHKAMILEYLIIHNWKDKIVHYYGHTRSWSQMGSAIASLIGGLIVFYSGSYRNIFLFSIVPYLLDLINVASYPKELDGDINKFEIAKIGEQFKSVVRILIESFKRKNVIKAVLNLSVYSGYNKAVKDYLQPILQSVALSVPFLLYLDDIQRTSVVVGLVFFIIFIINSFASRYSGKVAIKFTNIYKPLNITLFAGYLFGIISGLFYSLDMFFISIVFFIFIIIVENLRKPIGVSNVSGLFDRKIYATALSVDSQIKTIVAALSAIFIGFFADKYGIGIALIIISVVLLIGFPLYFVRPIKSEKQH